MRHHSGRICRFPESARGDQEARMSETRATAARRPPTGITRATARQPTTRLRCSPSCASVALSHASGESLPPVTLVTSYADASAVLRDYRTFENVGFFLDDDVRRIVEAFALAGCAEVLGELGAFLPAIAIFRVLSLPEEHAEMLHCWAATTFSEAPPDSTVLPTASTRAAYSDIGSEFDDSLRGQFDLRRAAAAGPDDAMTR
jgi:hypothetical protein